MFEKEAEEYGEKDLGGKYLSSVVAKDKLHAYKLGQYDGFVAGAEFGYNKANEWHFVKDGDLPKENKLYFVAIKDNGLAIAYFNGLHWETRYNLGDFGHCVETVIAWKEIVLPKESE